MPNALHFEFSPVMDDKSMMKSIDELAGLFKPKGITSDKEIILYYKTSVRAGIVFFTFADMLNYKNVKVYDEAFFGWQSDSANTVVKYMKCSLEKGEAFVSPFFIRLF